MNHLVVRLELDHEQPDNKRVALVLTVDPALPDGDALGTLYLPRPWVEMLKQLEPAIGIFGEDLAFDIVWTGAPIATQPDARLAKAARLLRKTVKLLS